MCWNLNPAVQLNLTCSICNTNLKAVYVSSFFSPNQITIKIEPCSSCLTKEFINGRDSMSGEHV